MTENINIFDELRLLNSEYLIKAGKENLYFLSEEFFNDFPGSINRQIWVNSLSNEDLYSVPAGYFENLPEIILDKLLLSNTSTSNKNHYFLPAGYFNSLADNILKKVSPKKDEVKQELEELSPLLNSISKANVFSVPSGYFNTLTPLTKNNSKPVKVISLSSKARKWVSYAAAACIAGLMFIGGYSYLQNKTVHHVMNAKNQVANVDVKQAISQLSDAEMNNYLNGDNSDIYNNSNPSLDSLDIKSMLDNTSDEEMNNYLLDNSNPAEKIDGI